VEALSTARAPDFIELSWIAKISIDVDCEATNCRRELLHQSDETAARGRAKSRQFDFVSLRASQCDSGR
jgi:hypothetical protein